MKKIIAMKQATHEDFTELTEQTITCAGCARDGIPASLPPRALKAAFAAVGDAAAGRELTRGRVLVVPLIDDRTSRKLSCRTWICRACLEAAQARAAVAFAAAARAEERFRVITKAELLEARKGRRKRAA